VTPPRANMGSINEGVVLEACRGLISTTENLFRGEIPA